MPASTRRPKVLPMLRLFPERVTACGPRQSPFEQVEKNFSMRTIFSLAAIFRVPNLKMHVQPTRFDIPIALERAFAERPCLPVGATARLLGVSDKVLREHARIGNIPCVIIGLGSVRPRRVFRLSDCLEFLERQSQGHRQCRSTSAPRARSSTTSTSSGAVIGFLARRAALISDRQKHSRGANANE